LRELFIKAEAGVNFLTKLLSAAYRAESTRHKQLKSKHSQQKTGEVKLLMCLNSLN
jgi:hypothetical protein